MKLLFTLICLTFVGEVASALEPRSLSQLCSRLHSTFQDRCYRASRLGYLDPLALGACSRMPSATPMLECIETIAGKYYQRYEILDCDRITGVQDTLRCLRYTGGGYQGNPYQGGYGGGYGGGSAPVQETKVIRGRFVYNPDIACLNNLPNGLSAWDQMVGGGVAKDLKGPVAACNNGRKLVNLGGDRRVRNDPHGVRKPVRGDFAYTDCSITYTDFDRSCYDALVAKAKPNSWLKKGRATPKDGQVRSLQNACSVKRVRCSKEVSLYHDARGEPRY